MSRCDGCDSNLDDELQRRIAVITDILREHEDGFVNMSLDVYLSGSGTSRQPAKSRKFTIYVACESEEIITQLPFTDPSEFASLIYCARRLSTGSVTEQTMFRCAGVTFKFVEYNHDSLLLVNNRLLGYAATSTSGYTIYFDFHEHRRSTATDKRVLRLLEDMQSGCPTSSDAPSTLITSKYVF